MLEVLRYSPAGFEPPARYRSGNPSPSQSMTATPPPTDSSTGPSYVKASPEADVSSTKRGTGPAPLVGRANPRATPTATAATTTTTRPATAARRIERRLAAAPVVTTP